MMPNSITVDTSSIASADEIARRLAERNRSLNRSAIEGLERIEKTLNALGGVEFFNRAEQIERLQKHWELINRVFPGFSELGRLIDPEEADDQIDIKTARASFVRCIDVDGLDPAAKRRLSAKPSRVPPFSSIVLLNPDSVFFSGRAKP
jgi:hypothetical protein